MITNIKSGALSHIIATILAFAYEHELAIDWLDNAVDHGFLNYPLLVDKEPWLANIRGETRFKNLMKKVKREWENFKV